MGHERSVDYDALKGRLARGWNTWDVRSMLSHVLLPCGLTVRLGVKEYACGAFLGEALVGRHGDDDEVVRPGVRSYGGAYIELELLWRGVRLRVESTADDDALTILVTPLEAPQTSTQRRAPTLVISAMLSWNRPGHVTREDDRRLVGRVRDGAADVVVHCDLEPVADRNVPIAGPHLTATLVVGRPVVISTGTHRSAIEARALLDARRAEVHSALGVDGGGEEDAVAQSRAAIQSSMAWNTVYDPDGDRVITPVSRAWSAHQGGWVLFCWDTFFAALLAGASGQRDLAYANAIEIFRHATPAGFVPNTANAHGFVTRDRSQPPVGAIVLKQLFDCFGDRWVVELLFDKLLKWNRWWHAARRVGETCLGWGSNPYDPVVGNEWETAEKGVGGRFGAALESGLDNSPMYDEVPLDPATHTLAMQDVGLTSLYVADCEALAALARSIPDRDRDAAELDARAAFYRRGLSSLWCDELGIFANRRADTGAFSARLSPTLLYVLLAPGVATAKQVDRMLREHVDDPARFGGEWVMPSVERSDPAYAEQHYWRGRIWPPLNFLVWLGLHRSGRRDAARRLAEKSAALLLREWRSHGHVHENYHADTGDGCGYRWSDPLYHWGGLLGAPLVMTAIAPRPSSSPESRSNAVHP